MILTLTGASGAGKTTIARELLNKLPIDSQMVPSYTTRKPRETDIPGEYKYVGKFKFQFLNNTGLFLWTAHVHENSYGTTKSWVGKSLQDDGTVYIMILLSDAIKTLRDFAEKNGVLNSVYSFYISSPSQEVLKKRLEERGDGSEEVQKRLVNCLKWDRDALSSGIPYEFVRNDSAVQEAVAEIRSRFLARFESCDSFF